MVSSQNPAFIAVDSIVVADPEQVASDLAGETVVLSMRDAHYYGFSEVASRIWELLQHPIPVAEICRVISGEYDVSIDVCTGDVLDFLNALAEKELVEVMGGA